jgi:hypothetical protein
LTVTTAFTTTPATGDILLLGPVQFKIKSKPIALGQIFNVTQATALHVYFEPTATTKYLYVRFYKDRSSSAFTGWNTITTGDSVTFTDSSEWIRINLTEATGKVSIPIGPLNHWRTMEVELMVREAHVVSKVEGIEFEGVELEELSQ